MKVLIVYDSVSATKMTAKVAETIRSSLKEKGIEVDAYLFKDAENVDIKSYDFAIVGSPTMAWKPTKGIMEFLGKYQINEFSGKMAAAFDTQIKSLVSGNATKTIEDRLKELGFAIATQSLIAYVEGRTDHYKLKEGQLEKTKNWSYDIANAIQKNR